LGTDSFQNYLKGMKETDARDLKIRLIFIMFATLLFVSIGEKSIRFASSAQTAKSWTFMVYLDADNSLENAGIMNFNQMETVGSTADINIVVQMDRIPGYDDSNGDWTGTRRYYVTKDTDTQNIHSTLIQEMGELDMSDPQTLSSFVKWAVQDYPAQHYALVLWDHGAGYPGVCYDDSNGGHCLTMTELKQALSDAAQTTGTRMDVLVFDACFMGMIEVGHQIRDYADFMVASEESEPGPGSPYDTILAGLASTPSMSPSQFASMIVSKYVTSYTDGLPDPYDESTITDAAYDLSKEPTLATAISSFSEALKNSFKQYGNAITTARTQSETFYGQFVDLYDFTNQVKNSISNATIQSVADNLLTQIDSYVIAEGHGNMHPNANGVTIYYPEKYEKANYAGSETDRALDFPWDTQWDEFLDFGTNVKVDLVPQCPTYTAPSNTTITKVAAGDVDGDGQIEVIGAGNFTDEYDNTYVVTTVYKTSGSGLVQEANYTLNLGQPEELTSVCCADSDNDMKDEIILTADFYNLTDYQWYSCIAILNAETDQIRLQAYEESTNISLESLDVKDVDSDGLNEIIISGHLIDELGDEYAYVAVGNNSIPGTLELENYYAWNVGTYEDLTAVAVGDVDSDGSPEIIVAGIYYDTEYDSWDGYVAVLNFTSNEFWLQAYDYVPSTWITSLKVDDVNGDGISELVLAGYAWDYYGTYYFYIGIAVNQPEDQINWLSEYTYDVGENEEIYSVDTADIDGDGISEILVSGSYYNVSFDQWNSYEAVYSWSSSTDMVLEDSFSTGNDNGYSITTADLDNDAQSEVISCNTLKTDVYTGQIDIQTASNYVPDTGSITGIVSDNNGPIAGVTVKIIVPRYSIAATTTTLANGSYTVTDLQPRTYDVKVYAEGRLNQTKTGVFVVAGQATPVQFELQNTAGTTVTVDVIVSSDGTDYHIITLSNSTVTNLAFNKDQKQISFNVTGTSGTEGFCNVTIPNKLLNGTFTVKIDGVKVTPNPITTSNATHSFVYFRYEHSVHEIQILGTTSSPGGEGLNIIPIIVVVLVVSAILVAAVLMTRRRKQGRTLPPPPPPPPPP
jgi:hypothetical protein